MKILDLHGRRHGEVQHTCHMFINKNWGQEMKIITGHSKAMKNLVESELKEYDIHYSFDNLYGYGYVMIKAH